GTSPPCCGCIVEGSRRLKLRPLARRSASLLLAQQAPLRNAQPIPGKIGALTRARAARRAFLVCDPIATARSLLTLTSCLRRGAHVNSEGVRGWARWAVLETGLVSSSDGPIIRLLASPKRFHVPLTGLIEIINDPD